MVDFLIPSLECSGNDFHPINSVRKPDRDSSSEIVDDCRSVGSGVEFCFNDFEFEFSHVLWKVVVIVDTGVGEPGGGFCNGVGTLEGGLEIFDEVGEGPKGGGVQGRLDANCGPAFGCSFCHEEEGISDLLVVGGINVFVYEEVGSD